MSVGQLTRNAYAFNNVAANNTASNQIPIGKTLENFQLKLGGTTFTKALISMFRLKANTKTIIEGSGTQLDKLMAYRGATTNAGYLDIAFEDISGTTEFDRKVGNLDTTMGIKSITTEVDIGAATAPTLAAIQYETGQQLQQNGQVSPFAGLMAKILRYPFSQASGGQLPMNFPIGPSGAIIRRVHVFHGGNMTGATVKENGLVIHETLKADNEYEQTRNGRVPQANVYTIDFVLKGNVREALDTRSAQSMEWLFTFSAADTGFVLVEYLATLDQL